MNHFSTNQNLARIGWECAGKQNFCSDMNNIQFKLTTPEVNHGRCAQFGHAYPVPYLCTPSLNPYPHSWQVSCAYGTLRHLFVSPQESYGTPLCTPLQNRTCNLWLLTLLLTLPPFERDY